MSKLKTLPKQYNKLISEFQYAAREMYEARGTDDYARKDRTEIEFLAAHARLSRKILSLLNEIERLETNY